jgi:protocatechuate 3,4-dioxygenase alpha subunit
MLIHALTRVYFPNELANDSDPALNKVEPARRHTLIANREESGDLSVYRFDIHMQGEDETVFFNP